MADEIENIEFDKENMKGVLEQFPEQVPKGVDLAGNIAVKKEDIDCIVIAGMGGSALAGEILKTYLDIEIPIVIVRDYTLPKFVNERSIVFSCSYSGNTEETIASLREATKRKCKIISMSVGGKLEGYSKEFKLKHIKLPKGMQPRNSYGYMFFIMLKILENSKIVPDQAEEIASTYQILNKSGYVEKAQHIVNEIDGKIPIIYSSDKMKAVAYKWKIGFNETGKVKAFYNIFPELNHNELVGYTHVKDPFHVIILKNEKDHPKVKKRMDITKGLISSKKVEVTEMEFKGKSALARIFSAIYMGDWACFLLSLKQGIDPSPVDMVEDFKAKMKK